MAGGTLLAKGLVLTTQWSPHLQENKNNKIKACQSYCTYFENYTSLSLTPTSSLAAVADGAGSTGNTDMVDKASVEGKST